MSGAVPDAVVRMLNVAHRCALTQYSRSVSCVRLATCLSLLHTVVTWPATLVIMATAPRWVAGGGVAARVSKVVPSAAFTLYRAPVAATSNRRDVSQPGPLITCDLMAAGMVPFMMEWDRDNRWTVSGLMAPTCTVRVEL